MALELITPIVTPTEPIFVVVEGSGAHKDKQPKPPERASSYRNPLSVQTQIDRATETALDDINAVSHEQVNKALVESEQTYIDAVWASDRQKAGTDPKKLAEADTKHAKLVEIYEAASAEQLLSQMNELARGADVPELSQTSEIKVPAELAGANLPESPELQRHLLGQLESEVKKLVRSVDKQKKLMASLGRSMQDITSAWNQLSGTKTTQDIYRYLKMDMMLSVVQENESAKVLLGDHGINHVDVWDKRIALDLADEMNLEALSKTRIGAAAKIHDVGYIRPEVASQIQKGVFGADKNHAVVGAKVFRQMYRFGFYKGLYRDPQSFKNIHDAVTYHDQMGKVNIRDHGDSAAMERSVLIIADNAAVFGEEKLPGAVVAAPDILIPAMYKIKLAKENFTRMDENGKRTPDKERIKAKIADIRTKAAAQVKTGDRFSASEQAELELAISQLNDLSPDFLPGRLSTSVDVAKECGYDPTTGKVHLNFTPAQELSDLFGRPANMQYEKMLRELGCPEDQIAQAMSQPSVEVADGQVVVYMKQEAVPVESEFSQAAKLEITRLRMENQPYIQLNKLIRSFIVDPSHPDYFVNRLSDSQKGEIFYLELMMSGGDYFQNASLDTLTPNAIICAMQTTEGQQGFVKHLLDERAQMADKFLNRK